MLSGPTNVRWVVISTAGLIASTRASSLFGFRKAEVRHIGQGLTVQVGFIEDIAVCDCQGSDADPGQKKDNRAAKPAGTDDGHYRDLASRNWSVTEKMSRLRK